MSIISWTYNKYHLKTYIYSSSWPQNHVIEFHDIFERRTYTLCMSGQILILLVLEQWGNVDNLLEAWCKIFKFLDCLFKIAYNPSGIKSTFE